MVPKTPPLFVLFFVSVQGKGVWDTPQMNRDNIYSIHAEAWALKQLKLQKTPYGSNEHGYVGSNQEGRISSVEEITLIKQLQKIFYIGWKLTLHHIFFVFILIFFQRPWR